MTTESQQPGSLTDQQFVSTSRDLEAETGLVPWLIPSIVQNMPLMEKTSWKAFALLLAREVVLVLQDQLPKLII
jgi:hypothetical protein